MTKYEFMRKLFANQIMPTATLRSYKLESGATRLYMRQEDAPNCGLSNHTTESGLRSAMATYLRWFAEYVENFDAMVEADHEEAYIFNVGLDRVAAGGADDVYDEAVAINDAMDAANDQSKVLVINRSFCQAATAWMSETLNAETVATDLTAVVFGAMARSRFPDFRLLDPRIVKQDAFWSRNDHAARRDIHERAHAEALEMNLRIDCTAHLECRTMNAVDQEYAAMRDEALKENERFDALNRRHFEFLALHVVPGTHHALIAAAHDEALKINAAMEYQAFVSGLNPLYLRTVVALDHSTAIRENERFDNLLARFNQFKRWYPSTQRHVIEVAHADALEVDKAHDALNESASEPPRWVQWMGRGLRIPHTIDCRCRFEPVVLGLRDLHGEALRDYWDFADEVAQRDAITEAHTLANRMEMQRRFYSMSVYAQAVTRILLENVAREHDAARDEQLARQAQFYRLAPDAYADWLLEIDHASALGEDRQRTFYSLPLVLRVLAVMSDFDEARIMDHEYNGNYRAMLDATYSDYLDTLTSGGRLLVRAITGK